MIKIQDLSGHGALKEPMNPLCTKIDQVEESTLDRNSSRSRNRLWTMTHRFDESTLNKDSCNISNTSDSVSSGYPNAEKRVENTTRSGVFLTKFEVFGYPMKHCLECLIYLLNQNKH